MNTQRLIEQRSKLLDRIEELQAAKNACYEDEYGKPLQEPDTKKARSIQKVQDGVARDLSYIEHQLKGVKA
jgi:hypothetical protein